MNYLSVCSGIEAATVAWHDLGWKPIGYSEIEKFPSQVLSHHYPHVPNLGDMTKYKEWQFNEPVGLLVGGTPCQSFSVAGLRKGLEDPRGNLMLVFLGIIDRFRPQWVVWENVPGVLSSNRGRDFGSFLGGLGELGYGYAYRVLDAQYFGVAQRRRRVFVVSRIGDWTAPAKVLFESHSLRRDLAPSRKKRKNITPCAGDGSQTSGTVTARDNKGVGFNSFENKLVVNAFRESSLAGYTQDTVGGTLKASGGVLSGGSETFVSQELASGDSVVATLSANNGQKQFLNNQDAFSGNYHVITQAYEWHNQDSRIKPVEVAGTLNCNSSGREGHLVQAVYETHPADSRITEAGDTCQTVTSRWGTGGGNVPLVQCLGGQHPNAAVGEEISPTLTNAMGAGGGHVPIVNQTPFRKSRRAQNKEDYETWVEDEVANTLNTFDLGDVRTTQAIAIAENTIGRQPQNGGNGDGFTVGGPMYTLNATGVHGIAQPIPLNSMTFGRYNEKDKRQGLGVGEPGDPLFTISAAHSHAVLAPTLTAANNPSRSPQSAEVTQQIAAVHATTMSVRRLTPVECERLQGFPDGYTDIKPGGKPTPDGPRYKALGNSMAVPVMRWIGSRIAAFMKHSA